MVGHPRGPCAPLAVSREQKASKTAEATGRKRGPSFEAPARGDGEEERDEGHAKRREQGGERRCTTETESGQVRVKKGQRQ